MNKIKSLLIANRGEIACRIIRTANTMNIRTIAIYSEADREALFVQEATEAWLLGPAPSRESYLNIDKILSIAKEAKADAIHPGYGFLSENATFARRVAEAGIIFVGPPASAIELMGSKLAAKDTVKELGIPMVPGTDKPLQDIKEAVSIAEKIGFPVLIKAAAGGGGKGMRIVHDPKSIEQQVERAISEAVSSFGDGSVFIEKYIVNPKHIEIQILADQHGNVRHLNERECSVQRRHQKVVEEAPSPVVNGELRQQMGAAAVEIAKAAGYTSTGTVEFIADQELNWYFLEMNTRLQVEHPVTEMTTGMDLVAWQIRIAEGSEINFKQEDVPLNGHAIELRVYAEDPENTFLPSIGTLDKYQLPQGNNVRVDNGYFEGQEIPIYYDPMISKLTVWGHTRSEAIKLLKKAILDYKIDGVQTTLPFGLFVANHEVFKDGSYSTNFVEKYFYPSLDEDSNDPLAEMIGKVGLRVYLERINDLTVPGHQGDEWLRKRRF